MIGKSINFLHQVCHDQTPTTKMIAVTKPAESPGDGMALDAGDRRDGASDRGCDGVGRWERHRW